MYDTTALYERASTQHGVVALADLDDLHVSRKVRKRMIERGILERVSRYVFRLGGSADTTDQRLSAACHEVGSASRRPTEIADSAQAAHRARGAVCGPAACWLLGIAGFQEPTGKPEIVSNEAFCQYRCELGEQHTCTWFTDDAITEVRGIPVVRVEWALFLLAARIPGRKPKGANDTLRARLQRRLRNAIDNAIRAGLTTDAKLQALLADIRRRGRNGVTEFEAVLEDRKTSPTESDLEVLFLALLTEAGLPLPDCQLRVARDGRFIARVDFRYRGSNTIIEVSGHQWHSSAEQLERDSLRHAELAHAGLLYLEFTHRTITTRPGLVVDHIRRLLQRIPTIDR